jgi:cell division inhibitor SulA
VDVTAAAAVVRHGDVLAWRRYLSRNQRSTAIRAAAVGFGESLQLGLRPKQPRFTNTSHRSTLATFVHSAEL